MAHGKGKLHLMERSSIEMTVPSRRPLSSVGGRVAVGHSLNLAVFLLQRALHLKVSLPLLLQSLLLHVSDDAGMHGLEMLELIN